MYSYLKANLETAMSVAITDATLIIDVATPQVDPEFPFVTDYVEYRRYETMSNIVVDGLAVARNRDQTFEIDSEIYSLTYMPNAIYLLVAPNDAMMYGSNYRCFYNNSYAQITGVE